MKIVNFLLHKEVCFTLVNNISYFTDFQTTGKRVLRATTFIKSLNGSTKLERIKRSDHFMSRIQARESPDQRSVSSLRDCVPINKIKIHFACGISLIKSDSGC